MPFPRSPILLCSMICITYRHGQLQLSLMMVIKDSVVSRSRLHSRCLVLRAGALSVDLCDMRI